MRIRCGRCGKICNVTQEDLEHSMFMRWFTPKVFLCEKCGRAWFKYYAEHLVRYEILMRLGKISSSEFWDKWHEAFNEFMKDKPLVKIVFT